MLIAKHYNELSIGDINVLFKRIAVVVVSKGLVKALRFEHSKKKKKKFKWF